MKVPLKKNPVQKDTQVVQTVKSRVSAYDIILGKVEIRTELIPTYITILDE